MCRRDVGRFSFAGNSELFEGGFVIFISTLPVIRKAAGGGTAESNPVEPRDQAQLL